MRLGDICSKIGSGATPRGGKEAYSTSGIPIIRSQNVLDWSFSSNGLAYLNDEQARTLSNVEVHQGDILLNITGDSVARACIVPDDVIPARVNQHVAILRPKEKANATFILAWLQTNKDLLLKLASSGATRNALTKRMLEGLDINLPSIDIQNHIAALISLIQSKINLNIKLNGYLEELCQTLFDRFEADENNDLVPIKNIAYVNPKRTLKKDTRALCVEMADLSTSGSFPSDWRVKAYHGGMKFKNGDTIMARITPCLENGKTCYVNFLEEGQTGFGSTEYIVMAAKGILPSEFFYFLARNLSFISYAIAHMNGSSGRQRVSGTDIEEYEVRMPNSSQLIEFEKIAVPAMRTIRANSFENRQLAKLRDALLPKLMSGEIDASKIDLTQLNSHLA